MDARVRTARLQHMKTPARHEKEKEAMPATKGRAAKNQAVSSRDRKIALMQDVDKLKKKLRQEENIHRALERAFNRPLGSLPRLPPYLPPATLELLAEVAVLEEEIARLEKLVVQFRQGLYQEAVYVSSSRNPRPEKPSLQTPPGCASITSTTMHPPQSSENGGGTENHSCADSPSAKTFNRRTPTIRTAAGRPPIECRSPEKPLKPQKLQMESAVKDRENEEARTPTTPDGRISCDDSPNKISETILKCLLSIFLRRSSSKSLVTTEHSPSLSRLASQEYPAKAQLWDPYGIRSEYGRRDIGPYKHLRVIEAANFNPNRTANSLFLLHRLKLLLGRLASVDLQGLSHQEKLAFWINTYNSCMMNAFLDHGIPESPEKVAALMQQATINVGGHLLSAITVEHFILRLPYHSRYPFPKGRKNEEMRIRSSFGLELSEPLVTFALSCGSWSSPAVRVYTASQVENELEVAKREYLQAAVGISTKRFGIPKLLDWYLLDFAKDFESLLDWICLQLPSELGKEAIQCLDTGKIQPFSRFVHIMPYDFRFRYLLCT